VHVFAMATFAQCIVLGRGLAVLSLAVEVGWVLDSQTRSTKAPHDTMRMRLQSCATSWVSLGEGLVFAGSVSLPRASREIVNVMWLIPWYVRVHVCVDWLS